MAENQTDRHELGKLGERIAKRHVNGRRTRHTAPFDIVDFSAGIAYEVKTVSALSQDNPIHISNYSMGRKLAFARRYQVEMVLLVVVIFTKRKVSVYTGELKEHCRLSSMERI